MAYHQRKDRRLHYQLFVNPKVQAPLVIYLHGLLMDNLSSGYFTFAHELKASAHVLLFDLIGHGRSSTPKTGYGYLEQFEDIKSLIEVAQKEINTSDLKIIFIGCSFGGSLGLYSAQRLPSIQSVILLEGHLGSPKFMNQLSQDLRATGEEAKTLIMKHFQHWLHRESERKRRRLMKRAEQLIYDSSLIDDLRAQRPTEVISDRVLMTRQHLADQAVDQMQQHLDQLSSKLLLPILFLYGEYSDAYNEAYTLYQQRQKSKQGDEDLFIKYANRDHALLWEETKAITQAICSWVNS